MFGDIAENLYFYLLNKNLLDEDDKEIYIYALEVILLNGSLLFFFFIVSLILDQIMFFLCYIGFFLPLRLFSGGYHAKRSETCFGISVASYLGALYLLSNNRDLYEHKYVMIATLIVMIIMFISSPIENRNHPINKFQKKRNSFIMKVVILADFTLLYVFYVNELMITSYEVVFVLMNALLFFLGKVEKVKNKWEIQYEETC